MSNSPRISLSLCIGNRGEDLRHISQFQPNMVSSEVADIRHISILVIKCHVLKSTAYVNLYLCTKFIPHTFVLFSRKKVKSYCINLVLVSPLINLYLYSGNYGEDTISNHIVGCYLFPGRYRIRH